MATVRCPVCGDADEVIHDTAGPGSFYCPACLWDWTEADAGIGSAEWASAVALAHPRLFEAKQKWEIALPPDEVEHLTGMEFCTGLPVSFLVTDDGRVRVEADISEALDDPGQVVLHGEDTDLDHCPTRLLRLLTAAVKAHPYVVIYITRKKD